MPCLKSLGLSDWTNPEDGMGPNSGMSQAELERKRWIEGMLTYLRPGKIVEFGCGSGFVLQILAEKLPRGFVVGLDRNRQRLAKASERQLENVVLVYGDATESVFPIGSFDTALFVGCLHEIYSEMGRSKVNRALGTASQVLKGGGVLAIQDFLKPNRRKIELSFKNEKTKRRFFKFAREFQGRKIRFTSTASGVRLDIADAVEFISKYRSRDWRDWQHEMRETHFFFTLKDYKESLGRVGFSIEVVKRLPRARTRWKETREDIGFAHESEYGWVMITARKPMLVRGK